MKKYILFAVPFLTAVFCFGQTNAGKSPGDIIVVKDSAVSQKLNEAAKDLAIQAKAFDVLRQQAQVSFDTSQKQLRETLTAKQKQLSDEVKADKKYKGLLAEIDTINKQLAASGQVADYKFSTSAGPIQKKIQEDNAAVNILTPLVRQENNLPDTAVYDAATQTWKSAAPGKK